MELIKRVLLSLIVIMLLTSCSPASKTPPYLGVFLRDGSNFTPLDKFTGPPDTTPKVSVDVSNPTFTAWLEGFNAQYFRLTSYTNAKYIKNLVDYNLRPLDKENMYDILVDELPGPDVYCFAQVDPLSVVYRLTHWCFIYNGTPQGRPKSMLETTRSDTSKPIPPTTAKTPEAGTLKQSTDKPHITLENANQVIELQLLEKEGVTNCNVSFNTYPSFCINGIAWSPDGKLIAIGSNTVITLIESQTLQEIKSIMTDHIGLISTIAFSPDGGMIASGAEDATVKLWKVSDGSLISTLKGHNGGIRSIAFSPDGSLMASGSWDKTVRLWRVTDSSKVNKLKGHNGDISRVAFSPDGDILASSSNDGTVKFWRASDGSLIDTLKDLKGGIVTISFSPDGAYLVISDWGPLKLWSVHSNKLVNTLAGQYSSLSISFSPDGTVLACSGSEETMSQYSIELWRVSDSRKYTILTGHTKPIWFVSFSPDGTLLLSGSMDGTMRLWGLPK